MGKTIVVNSEKDFEIAIIYKKKELNKLLLKKEILNRIQEKKNILRKSVRKGICLIGHSQIDNWDLKEIPGGGMVRNCGISGISSFEYDEFILQKKLLTCDEDICIIMHGTNDIIYEYSLDDIASSIEKTIQYVLELNSKCRIMFIQCIHVNGRLDRSNKKIDKLNEYLRRRLCNIEWISTDLMNDSFGNLKDEYTIDGLHLSEQGYEILRKIIEREVLK